MPDTRTAETTKVAALRRKTVWMFVTLMSSAPRAGPRKKARLSIVLEAPLAAVSSSGVLARDGIQAICAGRKTQPMSEISVASTRIDSVGASTAMSAAAMLDEQARMRSEPMSTALRGSRSARVDPMGAAKAMSSSRTAPQTPTSVGAALAVGPHDDGGGVGPVADHRPGEGSSIRRRAGLTKTDRREVHVSRRAPRTTPGGATSGSASTAIRAPSIAGTAP